ncbi:hypothetical protein [Clostridium folliculivorans]|uniref:Uncharacterized protein n=1 Tax=Clostridium folliculivorans TaxID=2886038 RepID=A0A9W6D9C8_9CLOT|nr:hypothetical protein [Clostridium folliculivorans]GKU24180.1 hypothetical protein CFOLD11_10060 [Clostridium folliculivorans]GKU30285.1 hypothetical protein CFB3_23920 [Clostridium folliculivorans]
MIEIIALFLIVVFYVIPLNLPVYWLCIKFADFLLETFPNPPFKFLLYISSDYLPPTIYFVGFVILFLLLYYLLSNVIRKSLFVFKNIDISKWSLIKYSKGQRSINLAARVLIVLSLVLQIFFKVIDIKIIVLSVLCLLFIFKELKPKKIKKDLKSEIKTEEKNEKKELAEEVGEDYIDFNWSYTMDALNIKKPIDFKASFKKGDKHIVQDEETQLEIEKNIKDFGEQIKDLCNLNGLDNYHKISAVYSLISKFKYKTEVYNKTINLQKPSETLERQEGDNYSLGVCTAAILRTMDMEVIELKIPLKDGQTNLALAVEGADELVGNYYINDSKQYFYCELKEDNSFRVGEVPSIYQ